MTRMGGGMLSMGKMKPERRNAGSMVATRASWLATSWLLVTMLIRMPRERAPTRKTMDRPNRSGRLPRSGTSKRNSPTSTRQDQVEDADGEVGDELAEDQLRSGEGGGDELLHGAGLPFPGNGQRGQEGGDDHHDDRDQAGEDVVFRDHVGVEPDAGPHIEPGEPRLVSAAETHLPQHDIAGEA